MKSIFNNSIRHESKTFFVNDLNDNNNEDIAKRN